MAPSPSTDNVNFRLPSTNSSLSANVSFSRFCLLIVIHQQDPLFRRCRFHAHLALETNLHFRLTPHWNRPFLSGSSCIGQFWEQFWGDNSGGCEKAAKPFILTFSLKVYDDGERRFRPPCPPKGGCLLLRPVPPRPSYRGSAAGHRHTEADAREVAACPGFRTDLS